MRNSKFIVSVAFAIGAISGISTAYAADLPARAYTKAPVMVAPAYNWTGFYVGLNGGYGWKDTSVNYTPNDPAAFLGTCGRIGGGTCVPPSSFNLRGALAGGQVGYNWQF